jgi:23S rRNA pseudouridine955/2504/2580 synthase
VTGERKVEEGDAGIRLDRWFKRHYPTLTHAALEKLLRAGAVRLDGKKAKSNARVETGQIIRVPRNLEKPPESAKAKAASAEEGAFIRKLVIAEEPDFFVFNKPSGLAVQGGSGTRRHIDGMLDELAKGRHRPRLVHRLDRDTSGVLVVARSASSAATLAGLFESRKISKVYWALVKGVPNPRRGVIDLPLAKFGPRGEEKMRVEAGGQDSVTKYEVVESVGKEFAWVALEPITGRTHQLRVHLAAIGHPIVGDPKYGTPGKPPEGVTPGLHLHARRIAIPQPKKPPYVAEAPLPPHMKATWRFFGFEESAARGAFARRT